MASGYHGLSPGDKPSASTFNDYYSKQGVMVFASNADRNTQLAAVLREGMLAYLLDVNSLTIYTGSTWSTIGPVHGALSTAWVPVVTQSTTVACTLSYVRSTRLGRWVMGSFSLSMTGTGTASATIQVSLPYTAISSGNDFYLGVGKLYDASTGTDYPADLVLASTTTMKFHARLGTGTFLGVGAPFALALATGDVLDGTFQYEAAADA